MPPALARSPASCPQAAHRGELGVGRYVRVYGSLKSLDGKLSVTAFAAKQVHDHNEVRGVRVWQ
jgi:hypothetical protein